MSDFIGSYNQAKSTDKQMDLTESAQRDMLAFMRESLGYQKDTMQWQKDIYERERADVKPYREASLRALDKLESVYSEGYDVTKEKQYQVLSEAGDRELQKSLAKKGLSLSGYGLEEEARLKSGLKTSVLGQRVAGLGSMAGYGTMGMTNQPMLANMGAISETYSNMSQVPAWYSSQMGTILQNRANYISQSSQQTSNLIGGILGSYLGK